MTTKKIFSSVIVLVLLFGLSNSVKCDQQQQQQPLKEAIDQCNRTFPVSKGVENYVFEYLENPPKINTANLQCLYFCVAKRLNLIDENCYPQIGKIWLTMQQDFHYSRPESIELTFSCVHTLNEENCCKRAFEFALCLAKVMQERKRAVPWIYRLYKENHRFQLNNNDQRI